jgi:hypothetical protein
MSFSFKASVLYLDVNSYKNLHLLTVKIHYPPFSHNDIFGSNHMSFKQGIKSKVMSFCIVGKLPVVPDLNKMEKKMYYKKASA